MSDLITVTGVVGSDPRHSVTAAGLAITSFRLASTRRYFDREKGAWADGETNWYTVSAFRQLATNAAASIKKGERIVVHGRLRLRAWSTAAKSGLAVEIDADAVGHDLAWGRTTFARPAARTSETPAHTDPDASAWASTSAVDGAGWATPDAATDADGAADEATAADEVEPGADDALADLDLPGAGWRAPGADDVAPTLATSV